MTSNFDGTVLDLFCGTVLDLFCGAVGGWSLGLHRAGYRTVAACEIDPWRREMFSCDFPGVEMFDDVSTLTAHDLRSRLGYLPSVVVGSPPCQSFSVAGLGQGLDDPRGQLFAGYLRIIREVRPIWCAAENVPGLRTRGLEWVIAELERAGYRVDVLDIGAENLGAPHRRRRLWIIGTRRDVADAAQSGHGEEHQDARWGEAGSGAEGRAAGSAYRDQAHATYADEGRQQAVGRPASRSGRGQDARRHDFERPGAGAFPGTDADEAGLALDPREPGHNGGQQPPLVGVDWLDAWTSWHGGCAGHLELAHGIESRVARPLIAAIGDSVCPAIPEAIGRVMKKLIGEARAHERQHAAASD